MASRIKRVIKIKTISSADAGPMEDEELGSGAVSMPLWMVSLKSETSGLSKDSFDLFLHIHLY